MASTLVPGAKTAPKSKVAGKHADDGGLMAVDVECLADDVGIGVELAAPPGVGEEDDGSSAVARVVGGEGAAHGGLHAEHLEEVRDDVDAGGGDGRAAELEAEIVGAGESEVAGDVLIGAAAGAELVIGVGGVGGAGQAALGGRRGDPDKLLRRWGRAAGAA